MGGMSNSHVVTGTISGICIALRDELGQRFAADVAERRFVAVVIRTAGGLVLRVFPHRERGQPQSETLAKTG